MECNKDDAIKAREIAEKKFNAKDLSGAKKFALKAHNLYPGLEGISQMLATLNVYAAAENPVLGEADFYGVLGASPQADDDTIRKQYRKLALMLHPDKNKSIGAEGAFKLISEAWSLLSDKNKRAAYDSRRNYRGISQKPKPPSQSSSVPPGANGFYNFARATVSKPKASKSASHAKGTSFSESSKKADKNTFWTVCHRCKMQYEYLRSYLNHNLLCPNCRKPFFAIETPPPVSNGSGSSKPRDGFKYSQQEVGNKSSKNAGYNTDNFEWSPFSGAAGVSTVAQAANVVQQTYEKVKRVREEAQAARKREKSLKRKNYAPGDMTGSSAEKKKRVSDDVSMKNNQIGPGGAGFGISSTIPPPRHSDIGSIYKSRINQINSTRELYYSELRSILMHKARKEILTKITEWKSASMIGNPAPLKKSTEKSYDEDNRQENAVTNGDWVMKSCKTANSGLVAEDKSLQRATQSKEIIDRLSIPVPDPDFYDFDKDRTDKAFRENQVWAVYDNDDGMPRFYAMIHSVISRDPFKIRISWLNSKTNTEFGPLNWVGSGFSKTCGDFRVGRRETYDSLNCFSHIAKWTKGTRGVIRIFPRKGDVWALYRNWSPDWNELTDDDVIHKYDMAEVLEDYDEELGVVVVPLVKVAGFKAVFHHHLDSKQVRRIPKEEIFRFSYQLPSHLLSGEEAPNAPKGCRELDPAALPPEFLQVIADVDVDTVENQANTENKEHDSSSTKAP